MKKAFIFIFILIVSISHAQDDIDSVDSLNSVSPADSLIDTSVFVDTLMNNTVDNDTIEVIDIPELKKHIESHIESRNYKFRNQWFNFWLLKENNHYTTLRKPLLLIRKEGFTQYPHFTESIHILQSEMQFYDTESNRHYFNLNSYDYMQPALISYAEAGMGDWDNSRGILQLQKGNSPLSDSLSFSASVSGINGYWFGDYETSSNINLNLLYRHKLGNLRLIHTTKSERIPAALSSIDSEDIIKSTANEEMFKFEHTLFEAGVSFQNYKTAGIDRKLTSLMLRKKDNLSFLNYDLSAEYIMESADTSWVSLNSQIGGEYGFLNYDFAMNYTSSECYFLNSHIFANLYNHLGAIGNIYSWKNDSNILYEQAGEFYRYGSGIAFHDSLRTIELTLGNQKEKNIEDWYFQSYVNSEFRWRDISFLIRNWSLYFIDPELQIQTETELQYHLPYNNMVRVQYRNRYHSEFLNDSENIIPNEMWHDIMLGVQITKKFEIRAEFTNISDNLFFLGEQQSGFTMLYNLTWYFIN